MRNKTSYFESNLYCKEPLPADVQKKLVDLAQAGSKKAQDELVETNLRFIRMIVSRYRISDEYETNDLLNEGVNGLIKAIYKFDTSRDNTFMSYAVWWIKQSISQYIQDKTRLIRQPANVKQDLGFILIPLHSPLHDDDGSSSTFEDLIEQTSFDDPSEIIGSNEISRSIEVLLNEIPPEEASVIRYRYGIDCEVMTYDEIEQLMKIKRARLRDLCERGLRRVRKNITFSPNREDLLQYIQTE